MWALHAQVQLPRAKTDPGGELAFQVATVRHTFCTTLGLKSAATTPRKRTQHRHTVEADSEGIVRPLARCKTGSACVYMLTMLNSCMAKSRWRRTYLLTMQ